MSHVVSIIQKILIFPFSLICHGKRDAQMDIKTVSEFRKIQQQKNMQQMEEKSSKH